MEPLKDAVSTAQRRSSNFSGKSSDLSIKEYQPLKEEEFLPRRV
jgi:hypothetical protein